MELLSKRLRKRKRKLVKDMGGKVLWNLESFMTHFSKLPDLPLLDPNEFAWGEKLEENWLPIRKELDRILAYKDLIPSFQDISEDQKSISKDEHWKTFFLYGFGYKAQKNCELCPETTLLIESVPGMLTAFFSILDAGKKIPEHRGVYKGILRYHLGLKVPEDAENCRIRVDDLSTYWQEGRGILFDDTYRHEVWNNTDEVRVVLLMDVMRPMHFPGNLINRTLINLIRQTGYVQDAKKNQEAWEDKMERIISNRQNVG